MYRCPGPRLTHMSQLARRGTSLWREGWGPAPGCRSQPHFTTASCTSQLFLRVGARSSLVLGAGGPGEAWMDLCSSLGAKREPLPALPEAAEMRGALPAESGEREPSACLPQPGSPGSAPTHRSLPPPPPLECWRCPQGLPAAFSSRPNEPRPGASPLRTRVTLSSLGGLSPGSPQTPFSYQGHKISTGVLSTTSPNREQSLPPS